MVHVAEKDNQGLFLRFPEIYCRLKECLTSYGGVADCELIEMEATLTALKTILTT